MMDEEQNSVITVAPTEVERAPDLIRNEEQISEQLRLLFDSDAHQDDVHDGKNTEASPAPACSSTSCDSKIDEQQLIEEGTKIVNDINEGFMRYLEKAPVEVVKVLDVLYDRLKKIKTVHGFTTACHTFSEAKFDVGKTDVLVCGKCHMTFYHIEEFQLHRSEDKCTQESILRDNEKLEPKEQVWAYTLWKNAILESGVKRTEPLTPWSLFKRWCALSESEKEAWIIAGQNLQTFTKLSMAKVQEVKNRTPAAVKKTKSNFISTPEKNIHSNDTLEEGEVRLSQLTDAQRAAIRAQIAAANKNNKETATTEIKKVPPQLAQLYSDLIKKPPELRRALHTGKNNVIEEAVFEKVLSRRFNHKNKCLEYFVKWENMKDTENTWEPKSHFDKCKQIMEEFDKVFNTSKLNTKPVESIVVPENETSLSRPARSSKQKAKDQVKSWCDSMSDDEELSSKRKLLDIDDDDDSSDSFEKKMKMEEDTDSSDDGISTKKNKVTPLSVNGLPKKPSDNSTSQRIVRVNQKHMPNLSTGVYIMSKTDGIIKLNSDTPLPGGNPALKVGQRIGQTQVKMITKDDSKSPKKPLAKPLKVDIVSNLQQAPLPEIKFISSASEQVDLPTKRTTDDSDSDGIPELEFPTDLPIPEPESPPGDFILDPLTGKIAGQEYAEETKDDPEGQLISSLELESEHEPTSLDSLVKMAVSDLPDVDDNDDHTPIASKVESLTSVEPTKHPEISTPMILDPPPTIKVEPGTVVKTELPAKINTPPISGISRTTLPPVLDLESAIRLSSIEKTPPPLIKSKPKPEPGNVSILNAALTNTKPPPQKKLLSTSPNTVRQKVVPYSQTRMPSPAAPIVHKVTNRPKSFPQRSPLQDPIVRRSPNINTYRPASNLGRRVGNTTIYKSGVKPQVSEIVSPTTHAPMQPPTRMPARASTMHPPSNVGYKKQPLAPRIASASSSPISMPLIGIDDVPESVTNTRSTIENSSSDDLLQNLSGDLPTINLADTDTPLFITGDDGTIYQVAGQNEKGQTILISSGPDGQQQCVIVSTEGAAEDETSAPMLLNAATGHEHQQSVNDDIKININGTDDDDGDAQVVAQIVKADPPSPGGTRKVVLMLPDGNLMMTDVTADQFAALELDKLLSGTGMD